MWAGITSEDALYYIHIIDVCVSCVVSYFLQDTIFVFVAGNLLPFILLQINVLILYIQLVIFDRLNLRGALCLKGV